MMKGHKKTRDLFVLLDSIVTSDATDTNAMSNSDVIRLRHMIGAYEGEWDDRTMQKRTF